MYRSNVDPDFDAIARFYQKPEWNETLKTFANIAEDEATVLSQTLKGIEDLLKL